MTLPTPDLAFFYAAIEKINHRLDKIESAAVMNPRIVPHHSSRDKFNIAEAISAELVAGIGKACAFEPNGKPCDHCSMCNSRGF